jgi:DnaK suppressor protein
MTELDNALLQRLEARLRERQEILWDDIGVVLKDAGHENLTELSGQVHDSGEESVADMLADLDIARISGEVAELKDIELALLRMKNATYGQCTDCGEAINVERLEASPAVRRCVSCQARYEDKHSERDQTPSI